MERNLKNKISIIVPFYNTNEDYLRDCIESLINQMYDNIEIIIVNDGSTIKYKKELFINDKVILISINHSGVSNARNVGINYSTGDYILFVDSDDKLCLNVCLYYNELLNKNNDFDLIITRNYINDYNNKNFCKLKRSKMVNNKSDLLKAIFVKDNGIYSSIDTPWAKLFRREILIDNNILFNDKLSNGEDGIFNYEVIINSKNIYFLNRFTYIYRVNQYSTCNTFCIDMDVKFIYLIMEYEKLFKKYNIYDSNFDLFVMRILDRLLRKYYSKLSKNDYNKKIFRYYDYFKKYHVYRYNKLVSKYFSC